MNHIPFFLLMSAVFFCCTYFYRRPSRMMASFCYRMTRVDTARMLYSYTLLLTVIFMHYFYFLAFGIDNGMMISSIIMFSLFNLSLSERVIATLAHDILLMWGMTILTLGLAFVDHCLPLAITFAFILCAASFYPSKQILQLDEEYLSEYYRTACSANDYKDIVDCYFSDSKNNTVGNIKTGFLDNLRRIANYIKSRWSLATGRKVTLA